MTHRPDRERIIKECEWAIARIEDYGSTTMMSRSFFADVAKLLKEQEPKRVNISQTHCGMKYGLCPRCEKQIDTLVNPHYCGNCGQKLDWESR